MSATINLRNAQPTVTPPATETRIGVSSTFLAVLSSKSVQGFLLVCLIALVLLWTVPLDCCVCLSIFAFLWLVAL